MVAYKLDLPSDARIHPVLHVSQLKKYIPPATVVDTDLSVMVPGQDACPVHILESRLVNKGSSMINQLKVRWSHLPAHYTTWEEAFSLRRQYPDAPAWGQAGFQGVGIVRKQRQQGRRQLKGKDMVRQ
jgi:hypothetical protein